MRRRVPTIASMAIAAAITLALTGAAAYAEPDTPTSDAFYQSLGIDEVPADYVVLVDTSASMRANGRYGRVKNSLRSLFAALAPQDQVTVVAFAGAPKQVWQGAIGDEPNAPIAALPKSADGANTDIGRALAFSVKILSRPQAPGIGTVILLTDGKHAPAFDSPYPLESGYAWDQLARAAAALHKAALSAYAIPLAGSTSAYLLKKVYGTSASVLAPSSVDHLTAQLNQPKETVRAAKAKSVLASDLAGGIAATWPASGQNLAGGVSTVNVMLRSTTSHLPLQVTGLHVTACAGVRASVAPQPVSLTAGGSVAVPITLDWKPGRRGWAPFHTVSLPCDLSLTGTVSSPWAPLLTGLLHTRLANPELASSQPVQFAADRGSWPSWLLGLLLALALAGLALAARWRRIHPPLTGVLLTTGPGSSTSKAMPLRGRRMILSAATAGVSGSGVLSGARPGRSSGPVVLQIAYSRDGSAAAQGVATCAAGETAMIGGVTFEWRPEAR